MGKYCPKCGKPIDQASAFCANCGTKLTQTQTTVTRQSTKANFEMGKLKQPKVLVGIGVVILLVGGYLFGKSYYSLPNQYQRITKALVDTDVNLAKYVTTDNLEVKDKLTKEDLQPLQKYFINDKEAYAELKSALNSSSYYRDGQIYWQQDGKAWFLFPKYKLHIKTYSVLLKTNHNNITLYQNGKKIKKDAKQQSVRLDNLFPGIYKFSAKGKINGKKLTTLKTETITSDDRVTLNLDTASFTVNGPANAKVYYNGKAVGQLDQNGKFTLKNYPVTEKMKLYLVANIAGKKLKSNTVDLAEKYELDKTQVSPTFAGIVSKSTAKTLLNSAFKDTNNQGFYYTNDASEFVGEENNASYNELINFFKAFEDVSISSEVNKINSIVPKGNGIAEVSYSVKYRISADGTTKIQQFTYNGAEIVKSGSYFKIQSIGKTGSQPDWEQKYEN